MTDRPVCAHGTPMGKTCAGCIKTMLKALRDFDAAVAAGIYDSEGYTHAERKAKERKERLSFD